MKLLSRKGFTLAELLIVMAIIVVLASVAIPTFTRQLETSRETADVETLRNAYTDAYAQALKDASKDGLLNEGNSSTGAYTISDQKFVQTKAGFAYVTGNVGGISLTDTTNNGVKTIVAGQKDITFTFLIATADSEANAAIVYKKGDIYLSAITVADHA